jgi:hypothetical protein
VLTPNLRTLTLEVLNDWHMLEGDCYRVEPFQAMFGAGTAFDPAFIPGLRSLSHVLLSDANMSQSFSTLPLLKDLHVCPEAAMQRTVYTQPKEAVLERQS